MGLLGGGRLCGSRKEIPIWELGETRATAVLGGYSTDQFTLAAFAFKDAAKQFGENNRIRDWGASLAVTPLPGLEIGASYLSELADSNTGTIADVDNNYGRRVAGWSAFAVATMGPVELSGEVLGVANNNAGTDGVGRPLSWNLELAFVPAASVVVAIRTEGSSDLSSVAARRYGYAASWSPREYVSLSAEYLRAVGGDGANESMVTASLVLEF